jgi:dihydrofolate reductase
METPMKTTLIWAEGHNRAIGRDNTMPWHIPEDFAHFRRITQGRPVLMGRHTWDSLPRKPLPNRVNMVLSRSLLEATGAQVFATVEEVLSFCRDVGYGELVVIGGSQLYEQFLSHADEVWVTHVDFSVPDADAFAPPLDPRQWEVQLSYSLDSVPPATAVLYVRRDIGAADRPGLNLGNTVF